MRRTTVALPSPGRVCLLVVVGCLCLGFDDGRSSSWGGAAAGAVANGTTLASGEPTTTAAPLAVVDAVLSFTTRCDCIEPLLASLIGALPAAAQPRLVFPANSLCTSSEVPAQPMEVRVGIAVNLTLAVEEATQRAIRALVANQCRDDTTLDHRVQVATTPTPPELISGDVAWAAPLALVLLVFALIVVYMCLRWRGVGTKARQEAHQRRIAEQDRVLLTTGMDSMLIPMVGGPSGGDEPQLGGRKKSRSGQPRSSSPSSTARRHHTVGPSKLKKRRPHQLDEASTANEDRGQEEEEEDADGEAEQRQRSSRRATGSVLQIPENRRAVPQPFIPMVVESDEDGGP